MRRILGSILLLTLAVLVSAEGLDGTAELSAPPAPDAMATACDSQMAAPAGPPVCALRCNDIDGCVICCLRKGKWVCG